jgi:hypothetical protein
MRNVATAFACLLTLGLSSARAGEIVTGLGAGATPQVGIFDSANVTQLSAFFAYAPAFTGGVRVAVGDVNGDGVTDIITGAGPGGGPHVNVFDGSTGKIIQSFYAFDPGFTGGIFVAAGDVNADGYADIIVGADAGGGPHVKVFDGATLALLQSFYAFNVEFTGGVRVASADVDGDGFADIVVGAGPGGGPHVKVFDGQSGIEVQSFYAFNPAFSGGVFVAAGDVNGDGKPDIVVGADAGGGPEVRVFDAATAAPFLSFYAYAPEFTGGVRVAAADLDGDGFAEIVTGAGTGGGPHVKVFDGATQTVVGSFYATAPTFTGGVYVAASSFKPIDSTIAAAVAMDFRQGVNLLENAGRNLRGGNITAACNMLDAFGNQVRAQFEKQLTEAEANELLFLVGGDRRAIGCR